MCGTLCGNGLSAQKRTSEPWHGVRVLQARHARSRPASQGGKRGGRYESKKSVWTDSVRNASGNRPGDQRHRACINRLRETGPEECGTPGIRGGCKQLKRGEGLQRVGNSRISRHGGKNVLKIWSAEVLESRHDYMDHRLPRSWW